MNQTDETRPTYVMPINRPPAKEFAIGIDPDTKKNGVALWNMRTRKIQELFLADFDATVDYVKGFDCNNVTIRIDAGWKNKNPQFHEVKIPDRLKAYPEAAAKYKQDVSNRIANDVGRNAQTGIMLCEKLRKLGYTVVEVKPTMAKWKPDDMRKFTGISTKNQEKIDAARLVVGC